MRAPDGEWLRDHAGDDVTVAIGGETYTVRVEGATGGSTDE